MPYSRRVEVLSSPMPFSRRVEFLIRPGSIVEGLNSSVASVVVQRNAHNKSKTDLEGNEQIQVQPGAKMLLGSLRYNNC